MNRMVKRVLAFLLAALLMLALSACEENPLPGTESSGSPSAVRTEAPDEETASPTDAAAASAEPAETGSPDPGENADLAAFVDLRLGSTGPLVQEVKELLYGLGLLDAEDVSQYYDERTAEAVIRFQQTQGLEPNGRVGDLTLAALRGTDPSQFEAPPTPEPAATASVPAEAVSSGGPIVPDLPPLTGLRIGIDPGHQSEGSNIQEPIAPGSSKTKPRVSSGTSGVASGIDEYIVNLQVGLKLRDILENYGAQVIMTRETNGVDISNAERAQIMNDAQVDLAVRLHCDGEDDSSRHGAFVLVPVGEYTTEIEAASRAAAESVLASFVATTGARDLGISERDDQTGFNWSTVPVINIEMGHMSNPEEDMRLVDDAYQALCAEGIALGIVNYFAG